MAADPDRYGAIKTVIDNAVETDTGVRIQIHWQDLRLYQRGRDTDRIDWLYRVHYLQWTGHAATDRVLGMAGLILLTLLAITGLLLFFRRPYRTTEKKQNTPL